MRILTVVASFAVASAMLTGCGGDGTDSAQPSPSPAPPVTSSKAPIGTSSAAGELAGLAAAVKGRAYSATYELTRPGKAPVDVEVELAADDKWSVEIPGGAHGGKTDVTIARNGDTYVQCADIKKDTCVVVDVKDGDFPKDIDPVVQHVFTDWLDVMINRASPVSVAKAENIEGAEGKCYWLKGNAVTITERIESGVYCLRSDGFVTAAKADFGLLRLAGEPQDPPAKIKLPDTDDDAKPLSTSPPPKPSPSKSKKKK